MEKSNRTDQTDDLYTNKTESLAFKCTLPNCGKAYKKKYLLQEHLNKHNKLRPFVCTIEACSKTFTKDSHLKRHKTQVHERASETACDVKGCGIVCNNIYSLRKHKNRMHNPSNCPFVCNICHEGFEKKRQFQQHNYKHTGEPPFKCNLCNIGFLMQRDLTKHKRNHKSYSCDCNETFNRWSDLCAHKKNCSNEDIACEICQKKFQSKVNLRAHKRKIHEESETFYCPYADCKRSYKYKKNLNFHITIYHEKDADAEFPCPTCGKKFSLKTYLDRHIRSMHDKPKTRKKLRAPRKDKGLSRTFMAAKLSGINLTPKEHKELLFVSNNSEPVPDRSQQANEIRDSSQIDGENLIERRNLIDKIEDLIHSRVESISKESIVSETFPDDILVDCNSVLDAIENCLSQKL
ncbi:unnamed protein product [Phyllotreta striolata]|uniref:C2H2-type domain-containing protein n=1 Tax=Phyllotreta striolata TaxID=444603 RepID=A0A9N9TLL5_PHYSR|nr:unnamed protein product [Phyllotreta striolata]